jgi:hypothetical protein
VNEQYIRFLYVSSTNPYMHFTCIQPCHMTSPTARLSNTWHIPTTLCNTVHIKRIIFHSVVSRAGRISLETIRSRMKANVSHLRLIDDWFFVVPRYTGLRLNVSGGVTNPVYMRQSSHHALPSSVLISVVIG